MKAAQEVAFLQKYLEKRKAFSSQILSQPEDELDFIIVIPCFNEPDILNTLLSIQKCEYSHFSTEIIIVINSGENSSEQAIAQNKNTFQFLEKWCFKNSNKQLKFYPLLFEKLPGKFAGAGLARRLGMDEAISRFVKIHNPNGIIISLDADTLVESNYLLEIHKTYKKQPELTATCLYFEHLFNQTDEINKAAQLYEIHMRYYVEALRFIKFPYAFHTVGSAFSVKALSYAKVGGMNQKQAGEDFYFLHKVFPTGKCTEITTTKVNPSSRISNRVPFGTGPIISEMINTGKALKTYHPDSFLALKLLFEKIEQLYTKTQIQSELEQFNSMMLFLEKENYKQKIAEIRKNSSSLTSFTKRFFNWFDAFKIIKYLNFSHEKQFKKIEVREAINLSPFLNLKSLNTPFELLTLLRKKQKIAYSFPK